MEKPLKSAIYTAARVLRRLVVQTTAFLFGRKNESIKSFRIYGKNTSLDLEDRIKFYTPSISEVSVLDRNILFEVLKLDEALVLVHGKWTKACSITRQIRGNVYWVDEEKNPSAGWEWCDIAEVLYEKEVGPIPVSNERLDALWRELKQLGLGCSYIFGTGPSLEGARERRWDDGYRIVCNTIVRDTELWDHIDPHIIVAGDGIYHFGFTEHARAFRRDLHARLRNGRAKFILPSRFYPIIAREMGDVLDKVIPVKIGNSSEIHTCLVQDHTLPPLPNVLNLLLLPVGCALSQDVRLWGFDGRGPSDQLFWKNSGKHSYPELMHTLRSAHPAFFEDNVPASNPNKYVEAVHGSLLENQLQNAEAAGWKFEMLHRSWTPVLAKRFRGEVTH